MIEEIEKTSEKGNFDVNKVTKSNIFVRSMLGYAFDFYGENFHNCYIGGDTQKDVLYLTFKKPISDQTKFNKILETLSIDEYYIGYKTSEDWCIVKMYVPMHYLNDFNKFVNGKYSQMSEDFKENLLSILLRYDKTKTLFSRTKSCLYPTKEARKHLSESLGVVLDKDAEVASVPNMEVERYRDEYFRKEDNESKGNY
tara:strand:+ start:2715 stop:3308 length:594 start_codon:yes stop_codon:yes gene_type:complete